MFWPDTVPLAKNSVMGIFSEPNQYRSSIGTVSDQYAYVCIRPVWTACLRAAFVELIAAELIPIRFTVQYQTRCQKVLLRFWVQIWIGLVPVQFCCVPFSIWWVSPLAPFVLWRLNLVSFPDPPPERKGGSGEYSAASHHGLAVAMNSAKR